MIELRRNQSKYGVWRPFGVRSNWKTNQFLVKLSGCLCFEWAGQGGTLATLLLLRGGLFWR